MNLYTHHSLISYRFVFPMKKVLQYKSSQIAYYTYGSGNEVLFCFHGYGLTGESFAVLQPVLETDYTLICIDLPFHGATNWQEGLVFSEEDLWEVLLLLNPLSDKPFSLMGYSMGGRIALSLLEKHPQQIKQVALVAPDGLKFNWWQAISTRTAVGNLLFRYTMQHPQWLFALIRVASFCKLIDRSVEVFTLLYISEEQERQLLYKRWHAMRDYAPRLSELRKLINQYKIPVNLLFGAYDKVITTNQGYAFKKNEPLITIRELKCGHQLIKEKYAAEVGQLLGKNIPTAI